MPVTNQRAVTVAKAFVDEVVGSNLCGVPSKLLTDQGRNFEADLIRQVFNLLDVKSCEQPTVMKPTHPWC